MHPATFQAGGDSEEPKGSRICPQDGWGVGGGILRLQTKKQVDRSCNVSGEGVSKQVTSECRHKVREENIQVSWCKCSWKKERQCKGPEADARLGYLKKSKG